MRTNYTLTLVALLSILAGCTDASNPVGPEADLRFTEDTRSVSKQSWSAAFDNAEDYKRPGDMAVLVADGKFSFFLSPTPNDPAIIPAPSTIGFMVSQTMGAWKSGTGNLQFDDGAGYDHDFEVDVQHVQLNNDGSVSFDGPIVAAEDIGAFWFFARAADGGETGDSFSYYLGTPTDEPAPEEFTSVTILQGGLTIYQQAF